MIWYSVLCVIIFAICAHANVDNTKYVESTIQHFADVLNDRIVNVSKTPYEFKYEIYHEIINIFELLNADYRNYSDIARQKADPSGPLYGAMLPCHYSLEIALHNQYLESRQEIITAFEAFENFTNTHHFTNTFDKESLKSKLKATLKACEEKDARKNATNDCEFKQLYDIIAKLEEYFTENDEMEAQVIVTQKKIQNALDIFQLFMLEENNLFEMCLDINVHKENTGESLFDTLINAYVANITTDVDEIVKIQENSLDFLRQFRNEGIDDIVETYRNLARDINNTLASIGTRQYKDNECTRLLEKRILDAYTMAFNSIEDTYVLFNASLSHSITLVLQTGDDLKSTLKSMLRSKKRLSNERRLPFFENVIDQIKKIGKYDLSKYKIAELKSLLEIEIEKALDKFYKHIFEAYNLQNFCLKSHKIERIFDVRSLKNRSSDKNDLMTYLDGLIEHTVETDIALINENQGHNYDSFTKYYTALSNITKKELAYRRFSSDVYSPCLKTSRNKTIDAFSHLLKKNQDVARVKYLAIDDQLKTLLTKCENLQVRLNSIEKECLDEQEKVSCLANKIGEVRNQAAKFNNDLDNLNQESLRLHDYYEEKLDEFRDKVHEIMAQVSICVEQSNNNRHPTNGEE